MGILIAYLLGVLSAIKPQNHGESASTTNERAEQNKLAQPLWLDDLTSKFEQTSREKSASDHRHYRVQNSIKRATWCAFLAASVYAGISYRQWWDLRRNFKLEQRPWIGISDEAVVINPGRMDAEITFANTGKTPARNVQKAVQLKISPLPLVDGPLDADVKALDFRGHSILGPQGTMRVRAGTETEAGEKAIILRDALKDRFPLIDSGDQILYLFGEIKYEDASGEQRTTKYCLYAIKLETGWHLAECNRFNEMD